MPSQLRKEVRSLLRSKAKTSLWSRNVFKPTTSQINSEIDAIASKVGKGWMETFNQQGCPLTQLKILLGGI
jgi:hypothetical protein